MLEEHVSQAELAKRIDKKKQEIINLSHNTKIDALVAPLEALGKNQLICCMVKAKCVF